MMITPPQQKAGRCLGRGEMFLRWIVAMSRLTFSQDNDDHADGNDDEDNNDDNDADDDDEDDECDDNDDNDDMMITMTITMTMTMTMSVMLRHLLEMAPLEMMMTIINYKL